MSLTSVLFMAFSLLELVAVLLVIFAERKSPASTMAWVLVLLFLPVVGFIAYLLFGSGFHVNQKKGYALKKTADQIYKNFITKPITCTAAMRRTRPHADSYARA